MEMKRIFLSTFKRDFLAINIYFEHIYTLTYLLIQNEKKKIWKTEKNAIKKLSLNYKMRAHRMDFDLVLSLVLNDVIKVVWRDEWKKLKKK